MHLSSNDTNFLTVVVVLVNLLVIYIHQYDACAIVTYLIRLVFRRNYMAAVLCNFLMHFA